MRVIVVLLLFFLSGAELQGGDDQPAPEDVQSTVNRLQNQSLAERPELLTDQTTVQCDVWTELRELRDMVVEQRVKLQYSEYQIEKLKKENAELAGRMTSTELGVEALRKENENAAKVAFSFGSGVSGTLGPFNANTILVFTKEITNVGNAYSPITGIFTAPVRGVYFFRFNIFGVDVLSAIGGEFYKNQEMVFFVSEIPDGKNEYASNGVSLLLEKGDQVYVKLRSGRHINDNTVDNHCTFSGFLLFPM